MFCERVKELLSQGGVDFLDRDIATDEKALAELEELGYMTTPVTVIDWELAIDFDLTKFEGVVARLAQDRSDRPFKLPSIV